MDISNDKSFFRQAFLDQPNSVKATACCVISIFSILMAIILIYGLRDHQHIRPGTELTCKAIIEQEPYKSMNNMTIDYVIEIKDSDPLCSKAKIGRKRKGFDLPKHFFANDLLRKGEDIIVILGFDINREKYIVSELQSRKGDIIADQKEFNEIIDISNSKKLFKISFYLFSSVVSGLLCLFFYRRARNTAHKLVETQTLLTETHSKL